MRNREMPLSSSIEGKIAWAERYYFKDKVQLLKDRRLVDLLDKFKGAALASHKEMAGAGVADECKHCEEKEGGSCCGAGLEDNYSGVLLLINLLLDIKIPKQRLNPLSCFFLGKKGCQLLARHVICVNYLCKKITDHIDPEKIAAIREREGIELETLFLLYERIKKIL